MCRLYRVLCVDRMLYYTRCCVKTGCCIIQSVMCRLDVVLYRVLCADYKGVM